MHLRLRIPEVFNVYPMIKVTLPDGTVKEFAAGTNSLDVAKSISEGLARNVLAAKVNGEVWDATRPLPTQSELTLLTWNDKEGKQTFWHSSAHLMAEAIEFYFPGTKFGIGPPIETGFYYDIDLGEHSLTPEEFKKIEDKMAELSKQDNSYQRTEVSKSDAIKYFTDKGDEYKLELIDGLQDGEITFYQQGNFTDLCRGPHLPSTSPIKAIKLMSIAGAYWRGDEKRKQLTRVYAVTFPKQKDLQEYLL